MPDSISTTLARLVAVEGAVRDFIEQHMLDGCGLVLSHLRADSLQPWTNEQLATVERLPFCHPHCPDRAAFMAYEDSLMATGEYAESQFLRFEVTGNPTALSAAWAQVHAILRVLDEGAKFEKGFLPKPFGGIARAATLSHELSPDQYIKCIAALRMAQRYAPPALRRAIDAWLVAMADYFRARNYLHPRRESMVVTPENRPHVCAHYILNLVLAAVITGDAGYTRDLARFGSILDDLAEGVTEPIFNIGSLWLEGLGLAAREGWDDPRLPSIVRGLWECHAARVREDGLGYNGEDPAMLTSRVLRVAAFASIVDEIVPELQAGVLATRILAAFTDPRLMRYAQPETAGLLPTGRRYLAECICETSVSSWLQAYWRLRAREEAAGAR